MCYKKLVDKHLDDYISYFIYISVQIIIVVDNLKKKNADHSYRLGMELVSRFDIKASSVALKHVKHFLLFSNKITSSKTH